MAKFYETYQFSFLSRIIVEFGISTDIVAVRSWRKQD